MTTEKTRDDATSPATDTRRNSLVPVPAQPGTGARRRTVRWAVAVVALLALAVAAYMSGFFGGGAAPQVAVETLAAGPVERVLTVSGRTETDIQSEIRSQVSARVTGISVVEGDSVTAGDVLVVLDAAQQNSRVRQALAALDAAILHEQQAEAERDRAVSLAANVSAVTLENAERDLALATAEVSRLREVLEQEQLALPDYRITAPIDGIVLSRSVEPGDLVSPSDILMRLADTSDLHVEAQIDELYADRIKVGQRVWLQLTGRPETLTGTVSFVAAEVGDLTGSLRVKLAFDTVPNTQIGLTTTASILIDSVASGLTVPRSAFVADGTGTAVFVVKDGRARLTPITFVDWPADRVEVTSGLEEGDRVVLSPEGIEDGQPLTAQDAPAEGG